MIRFALKNMSVKKAQLLLVPRVRRASTAEAGD